MVKNWIKEKLNAHIVELDLQAITRYLRSAKQDEIKLTAVKYRRDGMEADLDSASNSDLTLPILDELRDIISQEEVFTLNETGIKIKEILEAFIKDIDENSDLPAAKIYWLNRKIKVNMYNGEVQDSTALLRYLDKLKDEEDMDYVTEYIVRCEEELEESYES